MFNISKNLLSRFIFTFMILVVFIIFIFTFYLFFVKGKLPTYDTCVKKDEIFEINEKNYATILKASNENIDEYVGLKVHLKGYVYRLINFDSNQFVIARDMLINDNNQYLVIGFLSEYKDASKYKDGIWVDVYGTIKKGNFSGPIALLDITSIKETSKPTTPFVSLPNDTYVPTSNMF